MDTTKQVYTPVNSGIHHTRDNPETYQRDAMCQ